jgi:CHAT domain-containing protein
MQHDVHRNEGYQGLKVVGGVLLVCLAACAPREPPQPVQLLTYPDLPIVRHEPIVLPLPTASTPILVEVRSSGANLDTRVAQAGSDLVSHVQFEHLRSVPIYHFLDPASLSDPPSLRIVPVHAPAGATVSVTVFALPEPGGAGQEVVEAWRELAGGQQRIDTLDAEAWAPKLAALESAQRRFERLGLEQPALWAAYLKAYLLYFPLYRYEDAAAGAQRVLDAIGALQRGGDSSDWLVAIDVLAHQLAGQILLESDADRRESPGQSPLDAARVHFTAAHDLATANEMPFEATWAINNLGIADFYADRLEPALEHYAQALQQAQTAHDSYLVALIGSNVAVAQQRSGRLNEAVATLERIQQEPAMQDSPLEREHVLGLLGNYYLKLYRFPEALEALNEALRWSDTLMSSETRGRNRVMLGRAYREMGQPDKARKLAMEAFPELKAASNQRLLRQAHRLLADLHRIEGEFDAMQRERTLEQALLETELHRAEWLFSRAEDAAARGAWSQAVKSFRDSARVYSDAGFTSRSNLATLNACAAEIPLQETAGCSIEHLQPVYREIQGLQASAPALRARFAWVRLLAAQDHLAAAREHAGDLVDEIQFYRQVLPGVLGAWYWDARQDIFTFYLRLLLDAPGAADSGQPDALLALDRIRNSASSSRRQVDSPAPEETRSIHALLALRDQATTPAEQERAQLRIDRELTRRKPSWPADPGSDSAELLLQLSQLPPDWSLVAYYLAAPTALAWVGSRDGLRVYELGPAEAILRRIDRVKSELDVHNAPTLTFDLTALGDALLRPIQSHLRFNVMVAGGAALSDLPLDLLPVDGRPFIEAHQLMHIQSVREAANAARRARSALEPNRLFIGGFPSLEGTPLSALAGTERELQVVQAAYPAAVASVYTQSALTAAAFRSGSFQSADLIHLASHAWLDRDYPELSRLMLSGGSEGAPAFLTPADIDGTALAARLVVLSACETVGLNRFDFDNRLGFMTPLLRQSEALVVASLWPVADQVASAFMATFYQELAASGDIPAALRTAKLRQRETAGSDDHSWAAFQLFSR